ncbi:MAG: hypothetical protein R3C40_04440 [Parvularculaceae bacterium]
MTAPLTPSNGAAGRADAGDDRPRLDISGPVLNAALSSMLTACEPAGGVERYVAALQLKSDIFRDAFKDGGDTLSAERFFQISGLMPTVRRRVGAYCDEEGFETLRKRMAVLFTDVDRDEKITMFCNSFPQDKRHRWVRDLAAEILHNADPERYPLMCRWVWDRKANTGVLREIWYGNIDHVTLDIADDYETFLVLREELSQYLTQNGVFRDIMWYADLVCAQVYAEYISAQGGSYLRTDFSSAEDPALYLRRLLGLDGVRAKPAAGGEDIIEPLVLLTGASS